MAIDEKKRSSPNVFFPLYAEMAKAQADRSQVAQWAAEALCRQPDWEEAQEILAWALSKE